MYRYETHLHTAPVSKCGRATVEETLAFYKRAGYDGVFITNHFLDGNLNCDKSLPYEERIEFYFSDYEKGVVLGKEMGIKVFLGVELSYHGTDFLIYGLAKDWYLAHPQIMDMKKSDELTFLKEQGALVIQAHPYREASYIDHIRLYPRHVHGVEVLNSSRPEEDRVIAQFYAKHYDLLPFAGSDNHAGSKRPHLAGMQFAAPLESEQDFVQKILAGEGEIFTYLNPEAESSRSR